MKSVTVKAAREQFVEIVEGARKGATTIITRGGKNVAMVVPIPNEINAALPDLTEFRASIRVRGKSLSDTVSQQRRASRY